MICPNPECGVENEDAYRFCEMCGTPMQAAAANVKDAAAEGAASRAARSQGKCRCGAGPDCIVDGFCTQCSRSWASQARDHVELPLRSHFGAVTDRGLRHSRNEDDVALAIEERDGQPVYVMVVCDGVSSSQLADDASAAAATAARDALLEAVRADAPDLKAAMIEAILQAHQAVCDLPYTRGGAKDPPEATIVAALVRGQTATVGWLGDSRAYWIGPLDAGQISRDHSWLNDMMDGGLTEEEALKRPEAHAITRCLGLIADAPDETPEPEVTTFSLPPAGHLLLCSDGLWNYVPHADQLADLIRQQPADSDAVPLCRELVAFANSQGGRDNITAAILTLSQKEEKEGD